MVKINNKRKSAMLLTVLCLFSGIIFFTAGAETYPTLKKGDTGDAVLALKTRMYYLGYFTTEKLTDSYNGTTVERVMQLQKANGLPETGIADSELQELIFSDKCVWNEPTPVPTPIPTPVPTPVGPIGTPKPEAEGQEFLFSDREDGLWIYETENVKVRIERYSDPYEPLIWFETAIEFQNGKHLESLLSDGKVKGRAFLRPTILAEQKDAIVAFSDDFFGYRHTNLKSDILGILVRNGEILCDKTKKAESKNWPPLDVFAIFADGSARTFVSDELNAEQYLDMNVTDTYAFGPILVHEGEISTDVINWSEKSKEPRMAIGTRGPNRFCFLTVVGRRKDSAGATLTWMAHKMREMGAVEALNLDGGGTTCLVFNGDVINRPDGYRISDLRSVTSMIGIIRDHAEDSPDP